MLFRFSNALSLHKKNKNKSLNTFLLPIRLNMNFINYIFFYILHTQINLQNFQDIVLLLKTHSFVFKYLLIFFFIIFQYINFVLSFFMISLPGYISGRNESNSTISFRRFIKEKRRKSKERG